MSKSKAKSPRCQLRWHRPPFSKGVSNGCASRHVRVVPLNPLNPLNPLSMLLPFPPLKKGGRGDLLFRPLRHE